MTKKRHICFFTGKRGGVNHLIPVLERIEKNPLMDYSIVVADMHLSQAFGMTVDEVERHTKKTHRVETLLSSDTKVARAKSIGLGIINLAPLLRDLDPDLVFILGDRGEVLAMAICAVQLNIPLVHLFGGDVTQGGVDEPVRHAITKMANVHLASNADSAARVVKMGEEPWRVHVVGSPVLDLVYQKRFAPPEVISAKYELRLDRPIALLLQHPVTWQVAEAKFQIDETLAAIDHFGFQTVAVYPCSDPGHEAFIAALEGFGSKDYFRLYKNIDFYDFFGLMNIASVFISNSSAGPMESAAYKIPWINIGIRQQGRLRGDNGIDVGHDSNEIIKAIEKALFDETFRAKVARATCPYGDGTASIKIEALLSSIPLDQRLITKKMTY